MATLVRRLGLWSSIGLEMQEFDEQQPTLTGDRMPWASERVETTASFAALGVSANGTFIYRRGGSVGVLTSVDRKGTRTPRFDGIKDESRSVSTRVP